jgi:hypothetical protein
MRLVDTWAWVEYLAREAGEAKTDRVIAFTETKCVGEWGGAIVSSPT